MRLLPEASWDDRTIPNLQIIDRLEQGHYQDAQYARRPSMTPEHQPFIDWLNAYRRPLQAALRRQRGEIDERLADRGIDLSKIIRAVATTTNTPELPRHRVVMASQAEALDEYGAATEAVSPGLELAPDDHYIFNPLLGTVMISDEHLAEASKEMAVDSLASAIGQAATGAVVNIAVNYDPPQFRYWYGYQWHHGEDYYGWLLQRAQMTHIAAEARQVAGIRTPGEPVEHPLVEAYRLPEGWQPETGTAIAIDLIDHSFQNRTGTSVYSLIRNFSRAGGNIQSRQALADRISRGSQGRLSLEHLERIVPERGEQPGMLNIEPVELVEEAFQVPEAQRPSRLLREIIAYELAKGALSVQESAEA